MKRIVSLVYRRDEQAALTVTIPTSTHPTRDCLAIPRYPGFEHIIGNEYPLQEAWVTIHDDDGTAHRFLVAAQYSADLEVNRALGNILDATPWQGDLIVMRGGSMVSVVNMGNVEFRRRAEIAVRKWVVLSSWYARVSDSIDAGFSSKQQSKCSPQHTITFHSICPLSSDCREARRRMYM